MIRAQYLQSHVHLLFSFNTSTSSAHGPQSLRTQQSVSVGGSPEANLPQSSEQSKEPVNTVMGDELGSWENSNYAKLPSEVRKQIWLLLFIRDEGEDPDIERADRKDERDYWGDAAHYPHMKGQIYLICKYVNEDHKAHMNSSVAKDVKQEFEMELLPPRISTFDFIAERLTYPHVTSLKLTIRPMEAVHETDIHDGIMMFSHILRAHKTAGKMDSDLRFLEISVQSPKFGIKFQANIDLGITKPVTGSALFRIGFESTETHFNLEPGHLLDPYFHVDNNQCIKRALKVLTLRNPSVAYVYGDQ